MIDRAELGRLRVRKRRERLRPKDGKTQRNMQKSWIRAKIIVVVIMFDGETTYGFRIGK